VPLARNDHFVAQLCDFRVYQTMFCCTLALFLAVRVDKSGAGPVFWSGYVPDDPGDLFEFGVEYPGGLAGSNRTSTEKIIQLERGVSNNGPLVVGGGGGLHHGYAWRVWPLPPPGRLRFFCEWPASGVPRAYAEIDASLLLDKVPEATILGGS
jgi:hypothetical protein